LLIGIHGAKIGVKGRVSTLKNDASLREKEGMSVFLSR
jgi:hypothetical protein